MGAKCGKLIDDFTKKVNSTNETIVATFEAADEVADSVEIIRENVNSRAAKLNVV